MTAVAVAVAAAAGLLAGPVLRGLAVRLSVPSGEPWRRACAGCERALAPASSPSGRCPACRARLGPPPLTAELTAAVLLGLLAVRIHPVLVLAAACWLAACAVPLAWIDAVTRRLPDVLTAPAWGGTVVLLLTAAARGGHWPVLGRAVAGGAAFAAFCLVLYLISPAGLGPGDVKLAASLGTILAWLGWATLVAGALAGFVLGACYAVLLLVLRRADRKTQLPFGPFMIAGTFLVLLITGLR